MLLGALIAKGVITAALAGAACPVPPLPAATLRESAERLQEYRNLLARERAPDLMGFRAGPRLGPPSARERRRIRALRSERRGWGLNPSRLLARRLIRDHSPRTVFSEAIAIKVTRVEERELRFRVRFGDRLGEVDRYNRRCARDATAGLYIDATRRWPLRPRVVLLYKGPLAAHRRMLARRYRFHELLVFRHARYTLRELRAVQRRASADWEEWERRGHEITSIGIDEKANRMVIFMPRPSAQARQLFRERYGPAVIVRQMSLTLLAAGV